MPVTGVRRSRYRRPACPQCRYDDQVVRIVYGLPGPELIDQARHGEVALGGCRIGADSPEWYCRGCMRSFHAPPTFMAEDLGAA